MWGEADAAAPRASAPIAVVGTLPSEAVTQALAAADAAGGDNADDLGGEDDSDALAPAPAAVLDAARGAPRDAHGAGPRDGWSHPLDPRTTYSRTADHQVYCYFELANPEQTPTTVTLAWEDVNGQGRGAPTQIQVPGNRRFINYRYTSVEWRRPGTYFCVVRHEDTELARIAMTVTP